MTTFNRLTVPSFDLTWLELLDGEAPVVLIPGGGGSTKSGIFNQIQIAAFDGKVGFKLLKSHMTDEEGKSNFCSAVSSGSLGGKPIVCAVIDDTCQLLVARRVEGEVILVKKTEFKADFNTEFASVNCCFIGSQHVITGGEDGVCRLWKINIQEGNEDEEDIWSVTGVRDMRGHTAPIMSISRHPINPWIITASKDGSCKIFDVSNGQELISLPCVDGVDGSKRAQQTMECRGCVFSPEGNFIFSIQSAKRGPSHVIKWLIDNDNENKDSTFKVIPLGVIAGGKVPLTKLRISSSGLYVATGGSDGLITIYDVLKAKKMIAFPNHDLPVTGMSFAPTSIISAFKCNDVLVSCSADNRLATVRLQNPSTIFIWIVLMIVVIIMIYVYTNLLPIS